MPNSKATRKGAGRKIAAARAADSLSQQQRGKEKKKRTEDESEDGKCGKYSVGVELRKKIYFPRAQRAETGAERPLAALWVDSIRILSCFAGESGGRGDYAELQMVSKLFSE